MPKTVYASHQTGDSALRRHGWVAAVIVIGVGKKKRMFYSIDRGPKDSYTVGSNNRNNNN